MDDLVSAVRELEADAGIAHDGDADRCLAVDNAGNLIDGDQIMAILAVGMKDAESLIGDTVVATVMSNLGFKLAMQQNGIAVRETAVGDRYVLEAMQSGSFNLGGEQSGHVLLLDHATTGDGVMTASHLLSRVAHTGRSLADLAGVMERLPQVLINVAGVDKAALPSNEAVSEAVRLAESALGDSGRVLLRPSGTEPLVRVMVEAVSYADAERVASELAVIVEAELGLSR
jgi:phosphoglucosamine mutase